MAWPLLAGPQCFSEPDFHLLRHAEEVASEAFLQALSLFTCGPFPQKRAFTHHPKFSTPLSAPSYFHQTCITTWNRRVHRPTQIVSLFGDIYAVLFTTVNPRSPLHRGAQYIFIKQMNKVDYHYAHFTEE